ncbi:MAG: glycosyltransferase family 4 protein [Aminipila sp.]
MIGNHSSVKGGITSVISQLLNYDWKTEGVDMKFIPTYIETNAVKKLVYFGISYITIFAFILIYNPDVLHIHMSYKGSFHRKYMIHKLCKAFGKRDAIHLHGSEFKKFYDEANNKKKSKIRKLLRECDIMIVLGKEWNKTIKEIEPKTKTIVSFNTVKIPSQTVQWNNECTTVLFLGVLIKRKGVSDLLNAIHLLENEGFFNNRKYNFIIAGSGPEEQNLKLECHKLNLDELVTFSGWVDGNTKEKLIKESQLLVLPSYNEGLPIAVLEALSYGMPVISTKVGSINEAVQDDFNGYLVMPGNIKELANTLKLSTDTRNKWEKLSTNSRKQAEDKFDEIKYFDKILNIYK